MVGQSESLPIKIPTEGVVELLIVVKFEQRIQAFGK
jgi:hypothetical protein